MDKDEKVFIDTVIIFPQIQVCKPHRHCQIHTVRKWEMQLVWYVRMLVNIHMIKNYIQPQTANVQC